MKSLFTHIRVSMGSRQRETSLGRLCSPSVLRAHPWQYFEASSKYGGQTSPYVDAMCDCATVTRQAPLKFGESYSPFSARFVAQNRCLVPCRVSEYTSPWFAGNCRHRERENSAACSLVFICQAPFWCHRCCRRRSTSASRTEWSGLHENATALAARCYDAGLEVREAAGNMYTTSQWSATNFGRWRHRRGSSKHGHGTCV